MSSQEIKGDQKSKSRAFLKRKIKGLERDYTVPHLTRLTRGPEDSDSGEDTSKSSEKKMPQDKHTSRFSTKSTATEKKNLKFNKWLKKWTKGKF